MYAIKYHKRLPRSVPRLQHVEDLFGLRGGITHPKTHEVREDQLSGKQAPQKLDLHRMDFGDLRKAVKSVTALFVLAGVEEPETSSRFDNPVVN